MLDYKAMYFSLFNTLTDAIELLKKAQQAEEQLFIESEETPNIEAMGTIQGDG